MKSRLPTARTLAIAFCVFAVALLTGAYCTLLSPTNATGYLGYIGSLLMLGMVFRPPGYTSVRTISPREIFFTPPVGDYLLPGGGIIKSSLAIDGGNTGRTDELRAGWLLGQITASGLWVPLKRSRANGAGAASAAVTVDNAAAFRAGDTITVGANTNCVISSINYSTNVITLTATKTWSDRDAVFAQDGSGICRGVLANFVDMYDPDQKTDIDQPCNIIIGPCKLDQSMLLGDVAAVIATASSHYLSAIQIFSSSVRTL